MAKHSTCRNSPFSNKELSEPFEQDAALGDCVLQYRNFHESKTRRHHLELENSTGFFPSYAVKCAFLQNILEN